jgi:hypothetical protein
MAVCLKGFEDLATILSFALASELRQRLECAPAEPAALAAIDLVKLADRLPALLIADAQLEQLASPEVLVRVEAKAIGRFRQQLAESLSIVAPPTATLPKLGCRVSPAVSPTRFRVRVSPHKSWRARRDSNS